MNLADRVLGSIVGGAIGDAYGGGFEGSQAGSKDLHSARWELSDDTQLTIATCEAILASNGEVDPAVIAARFAHLHRTSQLRGLGASVYKALTELVAGGHWALVGAKGERAAGNGAAMRIAPLAFCLDPMRLDERRTIRDVARITHHHEEAYAGALAVALAVRAAWNGQWAGGHELFEIVVQSLPDTQVRDRLKAIQGYEINRPLSEIAQEYGSSGFVAESIPLAICGASRIQAIGFTRMIEEIIFCGGDADTTASLAGQVAGAYVGYNQLPSELLQLLPEKDWVEKVALDFATFVARARADQGAIKQ
jgi:ADP-ribosyl-[dinitrogen reductase] hydrolase